jgi:hypothetical protein
MAMLSVLSVRTTEPHDRSTFLQSLEYVDDGHATGYQLTISGRGPQMSEVFDDIIDRETDVARIAAIVASDVRFAYFGAAAFPFDSALFAASP